MSSESIMVAVVASVMLIVAVYMGNIYSQNPPIKEIEHESVEIKKQVIDQLEGAGDLNDDHQHAVVIVMIDEIPVDFSQPKYQLSSPWIHYESGNGFLVHRHASGVTLGYFFETLGIEITEECISVRNSNRYCTNENFFLKYFINNNEVPSITDYVVLDNDEVLVIYDSQKEVDFEKIMNQIREWQIKRSMQEPVFST